MTSFNETPCKIQNLPTSKIQQKPNEVQNNRLKGLKLDNMEVEEVQLDYEQDSDSIEEITPDRPGDK